MNLKHFGFSLVELTIVMGLAAGMGLVIAKQNEQQLKVMRGIESSQEIQEVVNLARTVLSDKTSCTNTLKGLKPKTVSPGKGIQIQNGIKGKTNTVVIPKGKPIQSNYLELKSISLINSIPSDNIADFELKIKKLKKSFGPSEVSKKLRIRYQLTGDAISSCSAGSEIELGAICNSITGAIFDEVKNTCSLKEVFASPKTAEDSSKAVIDRSYFAPAVYNPNAGVSPNNSWPTDLAKSHIKVCWGSFTQGISQKNYVIPAKPYARTMRIDVRFGWQSDDGENGDSFEAALRLDSMYMQRIAGSMNGSNRFHNWSVRGESMEAVFKLEANKSRTIELQLLHPQRGNCFRLSRNIHFILSEL